LVCRSVAVHVTVVSPIGKVLPELGEQLVVSDGPELAVNVTTAPDGPVAAVVVSGGTVKGGGVARATGAIRTNAATTTARARHQRFNESLFIGVGPVCRVGRGPSPVDRPLRAFLSPLLAAVWP
jgi:hypothetical protein